MKLLTMATGCLLMLAACTEKKDAADNTGIQKLQDARMVDSFSSSCPYLTQDNQGNVVLSWVRSFNDSQAVMCFAVSADNGVLFGMPVVVTGSENVHPHGENMPKIVFKPNGDILAAWGASNPNPKNPYSGLVYYSQSFDGGRSWTKPNTLT